MFSKGKVLTKKILIVFIAAFVVISSLFFLLGKYLQHRDSKRFLMEKVHFTPKIPKWNYLIDFDSRRHLYTTDELTDKAALSGKYSSRIKEETGFSSTIDLPLPTDDSTKLSDVSIKFWLYPEKNEVNASFVFSIFDKDYNQVYWDAFDIEESNITSRIWMPFKSTFSIPGEHIKSDNFLRIYLWNHDFDNPVLIDDINVTFGKELQYIKPRTFLFDFGDIDEDSFEAQIIDKKNFIAYASGREDQLKFSSKINIPFSKIDTADIFSILYRCRILSDSPDVDAVFVTEIIDQNKNSLFWHGTKIYDSDAIVNKRRFFNAEVIIPEELINPENSISLYLWNKSNNTVYLDNLYIVFKENRYRNIWMLPAFDFTINKNFSPIKNHPPYPKKYFNYNKFKNIEVLNAVFNNFDKNKISISSFDNNNNKEQLLFIDNNKPILFYFDNYSAKKQEVKLTPTPVAKINKIFSYNDYLFVVSDKSLSWYIFDSDELSFEKLSSVKYDFSDVNNVFYESDRIFVIKNSGVLHTFNFEDKNLQYKSQQEIISPDKLPIKSFYDYFLDDYKEKVLILIYSQNYTFTHSIFAYDYDQNKWEEAYEVTSDINNFQDVLNSTNIFLPGNFISSDYKHLVMYSRKHRFNLKLIEFNKISYHILKEFEFSGFIGKNPKFYEQANILSGNFINNGSADILINVNNKNHIRGFNSKIEIYSIDN